MIIRDRRIQQDSQYLTPHKRASLDHKRVLEDIYRPDKRAEQDEKLASKRAGQDQLEKVYA